MKVDLMKPIRRKSTGEKVVIIPGGTYYYVTDKTGYYLIFEKEIESQYENIPQKPREWSATILNERCYILADTESAKQVRVIEWPKDAPLPDLPET